MKEKMTVSELLNCGAICDGTEYEIVTCNGPVEFDPEDCFMYEAFADFVVDSVAASGDMKMKIFLCMKPEIRRAAS